MIIYYDEALTMTASLCASTGDISWEERYLGFIDKLDNTFVEVECLAPKEVLELLEVYQQAKTIDSDKAKQQWLDKIVHIEEELQIGEIKEDLRGLLGDIEIGTSRAAEIARGLRNFSRMDSDKLSLTDLHETIDATLVILSNKLKGRIEVEKSYASHLPNIECYAGLIGQVFTNILSNAADAIEAKGTVSIATAQRGKQV